MRRRRTTTGVVLALLLTGCGSGDLISNSTAAQLARRAPLVGDYTGGLVGYAQYAYFRLNIASNGAASAVVDTGDGSPLYLSGGVDSQRRLLVQNDYLAVGGEFRGASHPQDPSLYVTQGVRFVGSWAQSSYTGTVDAWHSSWPPALSTLHSQANWWGSFAIGLAGYTFSNTNYGWDSSDWDHDDGYTPSNPGSDDSGDDGGDGGGSGDDGSSADLGGDGNDEPAGGGDPLSDDIVLRQRAR